MITRSTLFVGAAVAAILMGPAVSVRANPIFYGPTPYVQFGDSPFAGLSGSSSYFYLETFEDGALNTPGVTASGGSAIGPLDGYVDSVDADDGAIDGSGSNGHSWYSDFTQQSFTFTFDKNALGTLPTFAGIVWTDCGYNSPHPLPRYYCNITFDAFGPSGNSLGSIGPFFLGDGTDTGQTAEDRFFGVFDPAGLSAIRISTDGSADWEVDHLQYGDLGHPVPEPASLTLFGLGVIALTRRFGRRRSAQ